MRKLSNGLLGCCVSMFLSHSAWAVGENAFRKALSRINVEFLAGGGLTTHLIQVATIPSKQNRENGFGPASVLVDHGKIYIADLNRKGKVYRAQWFVKPLEETDTYIDPEKAVQNGLGSQRVTFSGTGPAVQYTLNCHVDFWDKLRVGAGASLFRHQLVTLKPTETLDKDTKLPSYVPEAEVGYSVRPQGIIGYKFLNTGTTAAVASIGIGMDVLYGGIGKKRCLEWWTGGAQNLGVTVERSISQYVRLCTRLAIDHTSTLEGVSPDKEFLEQKSLIGGERRSILLQIGFGFNVPEIAQCRVSNCRIRNKHHHGGKYYRGASIFGRKDYLDRNLF